MEAVPNVVELTDNAAYHHKENKTAVNDFFLKCDFLRCKEYDAEYQRNCTAGNVRQGVSLFCCGVMNVRRFEKIFS